MPHLEDNGVRLWYQTSGEGEPLVTIGGWGLLHDQFHKIRPSLAQGLRVIDWNYRGCGRSDRSWVGGHSLDRWVDDLALILDHLSLDRTHVWGTSTGANIAIRFAARFPARVKSLITFPSFAYSPASRQKAQTYIALAENFGYEALAKFTQWIGCGEEYLYGPVADEIAQFEAQAFARNFTIASLAKIMDTYYHCDLTPDLRRLNMPVLILMGTSGQNGADQPGIKANLNRFRELCPHAETSFVVGAGGTYLMIEEPGATAPLILDWVRRHA